ncbi:MAG: ABC transporter permease subunit [Chloroflexota bacterium]|nr:ABC transporter permease subunit [Chloroflexota bacterium]
MAVPVLRETPRVITATRTTSFWKQSRRVLGRDWPIAYLFVAPLVILLFGLIAYPLLRAVILSFYNVTGITNRGFVGFQNYERLWANRQFVESVMVTAQYALTAVFFKFWIGLTAALLLHRKGLRFRSVFTGLVLLPWVIPDIVAALTWRGIYDPLFGGLNMILLRLGLIDQGISWLGDYQLALPAVIAVNIWKGVPFFTIVLLAGLKALDTELYDAAAVDGANGWQRFVSITLPGLRYVIIVGSLLSLIWTLNSFGQVFLLTGGGPGGATRLFSILAYEYAIASLRYSAGVAVALSVVPVLLILIVVLGRFMQGDPDQTEAPSGPLSRLGTAIAWPFVAVGRAIGFVLGLIIGAVESVFVAVAGALAAAFTRGDPQREGAWRRLTSRLGTIGAYALLGGLLVTLLFPFYWVIITAFKSNEQVRTFESVFWPSPWTTEHFTYMLTQTDFPRWFLNTLQVAAVTCLVSVLVGALGAYALVRLRWRGPGFLSTAILFAYLMPTVMMFIPLYQIFTELRLINTLGALMIAYPTFGLPFATWLLMGYYRSLPRDLEEAALIDGANHFQAFWQIILPLTTPALMAVGLFAITAAWDEFLFAFVFISSESLRTLPVGLAQLITGDIFPWGQMFAASIMTTIPVVIIYMLAQRYMVEGLSAGSVKG